jgi:hypothetical protein
MDEIRDLPVMDLSALAFAPYGTVILPAEDGAGSLFNLHSQG